MDSGIEQGMPGDGSVALAALARLTACRTEADFVGQFESILRGLAPEALVAVVLDPEAGEQTAIQRMATQAWRSGATVRGRSGIAVVGTDGQTPQLALAVRPFEGVYKSQIRLLGQDLEIPQQVLDRRPSLDSYPGQSDEAELGASYETIDPVLEWLLDHKGAAEKVVSLGYPSEVVERVQARLERRRDVPLAAVLE
jgi:hypothetical protein